MGSSCFEKRKKKIYNPTNKNGKTGNKGKPPIPSPIIIETSDIEKKDLTKLNKFQENQIIQDDFFIREEDKKDFIYYNLKKYERQKLEKIFKNKCENFKNNHLSKLKLAISILI